MDENEIRLDSIKELIDRAFSSRLPMLVSTMQLLDRIRAIAAKTEESEAPAEATTAPSPPEKVIVSCDASIKKNPGGPAAVGFVIQDRDKPPIRMAHPTPATTNNQAEYDAVYQALTTYAGLVNNPGCEIEVRSDSQLVVKQLNGEMQCNDKKLEKRRDTILELTKELPVPVKFVWRPRNSTPELESANYLAQDLLDVPRH